MNIATNTSISPIGGIARRVRELRRRVEAVCGPDRLVIVEIHPETRSVEENRCSKLYRIPLPESLTLNTVYSGVKSLEELEERFNPTIKEIENILEKEKVEVVLSEGTYYAPWCLYRASKNRGLPLIILYAGVLKYETEHFPDDIRRVMVEMEKSFIDPELMYIFPSQLTKSCVESEYGSLNRARIIPNGISREFFELEPKNGSSALGFVGRVSRTKNPEYLLLLRDELKRQKKKMRIFMVSDVNHKSRLRKRLSRAKIITLSAMDTICLREFYRDMAVLISPSYFETYGNVPAEAVASGTPALISETMGVAEIFKEHGLNHFITDFNDVREVVERIDEFRNHRVSKEVRESLKRYIWDSVIDCYFNICRGEIDRGI